MEETSITFTQLDNYICWVIQTNGLAYVIENYRALREHFYYMRAT